MGRPYLGSAVAHLIVGCICVAAGIAYMVLLAFYLPLALKEQTTTAATPPAADATTMSAYAAATPNVIRDLRDKHMEWVAFLLASKIWCGFWFIVTGIVGARTREKNCSETTYLTLSVLNVILWAPGMMVLNAISLAFIFLVGPLILFALTDAFLWVLVFPVIGVFFGLVEFILSIVSCSMVCCCSRTASALTHTGPAGYQYEMKYQM